MTSDAQTLHISVLLQEVVEMIQAHQPGTYVDCTFGGGGHTRAILDAHAENTVIAFDRDRAALDRAHAWSALYVGRLTLRHARFSELNQFVEPHSVRGIVADLGLSTDQLKGDRGFSFGDDSPLDMRMDQTQTTSAGDIVNHYSESELFRMFKQGGVGREARAISQAIVKHRPITSTKQLADIIAKAAYGKSSKRSVHPATVPFQALRVAVNDEGHEIESLLDAVPMLIEPAGRVAIITFHSLEDTLVTRRMRAWQSADSAPAWWPKKSEGKLSQGRLLTPKGVCASRDEAERNPSARSARLRVFEFV